MADPIQIHAPDGSVVEFPAGTADATIKGAMAKAFGGPKEATPKEGGGVFETIDNGVRALANGLTFGLADRMAAGAGAVTGIGGKQGDYAGNLATEQAKTADFEKEHPVASTALNIAGGAAVPIGAVGAAAKGATLLTKSLRAAGAGATIGSVQGGLGSKDWTDIPQTAKDALIGGTGGFILGGAIPGAGRVVGKGYNAMADALLGGAKDISRGASTHLLDAMRADGAPAVNAAMARLGDHGMLADAGPAFLGKAQGAAGNSDEGRSILANALMKRNEGTNARIAGDVERALGPAEDPQTVTNAIRAHRTDTDAWNYGRALHNGAPPVDTTALLARLGPMIGESEGMEKQALTKLRDSLMTERPFPVIDPVNGRQMIANGVPVTEMRRVPQDNAINLHKIKGEIDNVVQYDAPGLGVPAGALSRQQGALKQLRGDLNATLEAQVPGYRRANDASAALARRGEAVEQGTQYMGSGKTTPSPDRFAAEFATREPGEQIAFAKGSRGNIDRVLGTKANDLQALRGELQGEGGWNTAKIGTVHGQDAADTLMRTVDQNLKFRDTYNKVVEGSQTDIRNAARTAMKPSPATETPLINPNASITGILGTIGKKAVNGVINSMRPDPTRAYGEIAQILTAQGPQRDAHIKALADALLRQQGNAATAPKVGDRAALAAALMGNAYLNHDRPLRLTVHPGHPNSGQAQ